MTCAGERVYVLEGENFQLTSLSSARRMSSYLMGEIFLQVVAQIWAEQIFNVNTKSPIATYTTINFYSSAAVAMNHYVPSSV